MKIGNPDNSNKAALPPVTTTGSDPKAPARSGEGVAPTTVDADSAKVELTSSAAARAAADSGAEFDAAKVERIAQAIRDGHYRIDAEAIADKLIANAAEVLGRVPR